MNGNSFGGTIRAIANAEIALVRIQGVACNVGVVSGGRPPHLDKQYIRVERNCRRTRTDRYGISGRRMISWIIDSSSRRWISRVRHNPSFLLCVPVWQAVTDRRYPRSHHLYDGPQEA